MTLLFAASILAAARGRWDTATVLDRGLPVPSQGCAYARTRGTVLRRGTVVEVLRPVGLTLKETLLDPPCCVSLRLRWRLEPLEEGSLVRLEARYTLNGAATLRARHWRGRIDLHCERLLAAMRTHVARLSEAQDSGTSGHSTGSTAITSTKSSTVNGKPTFR